MTKVKVKPGRIYRGGSWFNRNQSLRIAVTSWAIPYEAPRNLGFRTALTARRAR